MCPDGMQAWIAQQHFDGIARCRIAVVAASPVSTPARAWEFGAGGLLAFAAAVLVAPFAVFVVVVAVASVGVGCLIAFTFVERIYNFVMDPLYRLLPKGTPLAPEPENRPRGRPRKNPID